MKEEECEGVSVGGERVFGECEISECVNVNDGSMRKKCEG